MRKTLLTLALAAVSLCAGAQKYMAVHLSDSVLYLPVESVDSINFVDNIETPNHGTAPEGVVAVDLGLPSGTKWANMNVGASTPEAYGDYFAWGETVPYGLEDTSNAHNYSYAGTYTKTYYYWNTYKWCNGSYDTQTKYCMDSSYGTVDNKTELDLEDDAAYVNWGSDWRMPTYDQIYELKWECTWTWTTMSDIKGYRVTGPSGNSIFLPAAGYRSNSSLDGAGSCGYYWSSELYSGYSSDAWELYFDSGGVSTSSDYRYFGQSVRPVLCSASE